MSKSDNLNHLKRRIQAAKGEIPADLVLKNGRVVNVLSGLIHGGDVAVYDGIIVGLGPEYRGKNEVDVSGKWITPGLMDGHIHIESSMLLPSRLAAALLPFGTTSIVSDPHEIANVLGLEGVRLMMEESLGLPFDIFFMAPSCVPATHFETSGAQLKASDLSALKGKSRVLGLAEMMNFPGVLTGDQEVLEKIILFQDQVVDGHAPFLTGYDLQAYLSAGIMSDHETSGLNEAQDKLNSGMFIMIREGTSAKNLEDLLPLVNRDNAQRFCFVSDDLHPREIIGRGHLNHIVKKAIGLGMDPVTAIRMVTINPAAYFGLKRRCAVAPGYRADLVILEDLKNFQVERVYKNGILTVEGGRLVESFPEKNMKINPVPLNVAPLNPKNFLIPHMGGPVRIIELIPGQILTGLSYGEAKSRGKLTADLESDILLLTVVERHQATGNIGTGLVKGFGLKGGALATSVAHDSHNIIAVGTGHLNLFRAVNEVKEMGGGMVVVDNEGIVARLPLELGGLMSNQPIERLNKGLGELNRAAQGLNCTIREPFMILSFLALPVIPELKLTDQGLVDVNAFEHVPLFVRENEVSEGYS